MEIIFIFIPFILGYIFAHKIIGKYMFSKLQTPRKEPISGIKKIYMSLSAALVIVFGTFLLPTLFGIILANLCLYSQQGNPESGSCGWIAFPFIVISMFLSIPFLIGHFLYYFANIPKVVLHKNKKHS